MDQPIIEKELRSLFFPEMKYYYHKKAFENMNFTYNKTPSMPIVISEKGKRTKNIVNIYGRFSD